MTLSLTPSDLWIVGWLVLLEGLLSVDNALVLALMVRVLPENRQKRALKYGMWGAFIFRAIAVFLAIWLIKFWWLKLVGGGYLLWVAYAGLTHKEEHDAASGSGSGFWAVVLKVELMDLAFSVDAILAAVAMTDKTWLIITGGIIGIVIMRYAAGLFIKLLGRYPNLKNAAYVLVAIIGAKLVISVWWHPPHWLFFGSLAVVLLGAFAQGQYRSHKSSRGKVQKRP